MQAAFEKIVEKLEELHERYINQYGAVGENPMAFSVKECMEIVKQEVEKYEECYKDCGDCEAYNKEKYHCPKFCNVIKETVKEIEENHNGWIPCSERLPEEHKLYDITTKNEIGIHSDTAIYNPFVGMWFWDESESKHIEIEVLAWKEKDKPYQPNGEHDENTK